MASQEPGFAGDDDSASSGVRVAGPPASVKSARTARSVGGGPRGCHSCGGSPTPFSSSGVRLCARCNAAMRAKHRTLRQDDPNLVRDDQIAMVQDADQWRQDLKVWMDNKDRVAARNGLKKTLTSTKKRKSKGMRRERHDGEIELTKTRYKKFVNMWDDVESSEAESEFERLLITQGGDKTVWIQDVGRKRGNVDFSESATDIEQVEVPDDDDDDDAQGPRPRGVAQVGGGTRGKDQARGRGRSRSRARGARSRSRGRASGTKGKGKARSERARSRSRCRSAGLKKQAGGEGTPNKTVDYLAQRDDLHSKISERAKAAQDLTNKLKKAIGDFEKKHGSVDETDLPTSGPALLKKAQEVSEELTSCASECKQVKQASWTTLKATFDAASSSLNDLTVSVMEHLGALNYILKGKAKEQRSMYQTKRWQITKLSQGFVAGAFDPDFAKVLGASVFSINEKFKPTDMKTCMAGSSDVATDVAWKAGEVHKVVVWSGSSDTFPCPKSTFSDNIEAFNVKLESFKEVLHEHQKWHGAMGVITEVTLDKAFPPIGDMQAFESPGGKPWMVALRPGAKRMSPKNFPLPGYPSLVYSLDEIVVMICVPVSGVLSRGITLANIEQFLSTKDGGKHVEECGCIFRLAKGNVAFIPFGWWPILTSAPLVALDEESAKKASKKKDTVETIASVVVVPLLEKNLWKGIEPAVFRAVCDANEEHFKSKALVEMWKHRKEVVDAAIAE